jgi:hypothetical protein
LNAAPYFFGTGAGCAVVGGCLGLLGPTVGGVVVPWTALESGPVKSEHAARRPMVPARRMRRRDIEYLPGESADAECGSGCTAGCVCPDAREHGSTGCARG